MLTRHIHVPVLRLESENIRKKEKILKKNDFLIFSFIVKNIKKIKYNQNSSNFYIFSNFLLLV